MAIVGIDLDTTNSLVALWTDTASKILENALGDTLTPSAISIAVDDLVLVGRAAIDRLITPDLHSGPERWVTAQKSE